MNDNIYASIFGDLFGAEQGQRDSIEFAAESAFERWMVDSKVRRGDRAYYIAREPFLRKFIEGELLRLGVA